MMLRYFLLITFLFISNVYPSPIDPPTEVDIVGGKRVDIEDYPYAVSILDADGLLCGGVIISNLHVLTAGHCVFYAAEEVVIHAGSSYWNKDGSYHTVLSNATMGTFRSVDLAIIRVKEPFNFDDTCQEIPLFASGESPKPNAVAVVVGWGETQANDISQQLRAISIPIISRKKCRYIFANSTIGEIVDGEICAGNLEHGGKDSCSGDSGGPLVVNGRLAGIVSMGEGCARPHFPGVYTDVGFYNKWIVRQMSQ